MSKKMKPNGDGASECQCGAGDRTKLNLLRLRDVTERTTLSPSTIYKLISEGRFPPPVRLAARARAWPEYLIDAWLAVRIAARDEIRHPSDMVSLPMWTRDMETGCREQGIWMLRLPSVLRRVGFRKSHLYRLIAEGSFPVPVPLGERARAWVRSEVDAWVCNRIEERRLDPGFRFLTFTLPRGGT